jgi:hypothetical protein
MPILGVIASSTQQGLSTNSFESIQTVTVGAGGSSTISFTAIPGTYKHLQLRCSWRTATAGEMRFNYNGDTSASLYYRQFSQGNGSGTQAGFGNQREFGGYNDSTISFCTTIADILDYTNASKATTVRSLWGFDKNASGGYTGMTTGIWTNTNAITSLDLTSSGGNYVEHSRFALYGIKG